MTAAEVARRFGALDRLRPDWVAAWRRGWHEAASFAAARLRGQGRRVAVSYPENAVARARTNNFDTLRAIAAVMVLFPTHFRWPGTIGPSRSGA